MSLETVVAYPGLTLQDAGRPGYRRFGIAVGGAFDRGSLIAANRLLGNRPDCACLEFTLAGGSFRAREAHFVAVSGAECTVSVEAIEQDRRRPIAVPIGATLTIGSMTRGARAYLAVAGGFQAPPILGSVSGIVVRKGDVIAVAPSSFAAGDEQARLAASLGGGPIRIVEASHTTSEARATLGRESFTVSNYSNRIGIRLEGPPIPPQPEIVSEPMCVGVVQLAGNGLPVVIGPDGPTIGGYPKVACVIEADHDRLGQLVPGDRIEFLWVDQATAAQLPRADDADV